MKLCCINEKKEKRQSLLKTLLVKNIFHFIPDLLHVFSQRAITSICSFTILVKREAFESVSKHNQYR